MTLDLRAICGCDVSRETTDRLSAYVDMLIAESERQNLVATSTIENIWNRHIADSAQLIRVAGEGSWVDIGSGAGLPGLVIAILAGAPTTLIEPRKLRADFLQRVTRSLALPNVQVVATKAQAAVGSFDFITARAVAPAVELLSITSHLTHSGTKYLLMKGRTAAKELEEAQVAWHGAFRLVSSCTDPEAAIIVAEGVRRKGRSQ